MGDGVKKPLKSNTYARARARMLEPYAACLDGDAEAYLCVVSQGPAEEAARRAVEASAERIGYGKACFVRLDKLPEGEAFRLIEALDPLALVILDEDAARAFESAYRLQVKLDAQGSLFGRPVVAFRSFVEDLGSERLKQRDWALLKKLRPRFA